MGSPGSATGSPSVGAASTPMTEAATAVSNASSAAPFDVASPISMGSNTGSAPNEVSVVTNITAVPGTWQSHLRRLRRRFLALDPKFQIACVAGAVVLVLGSIGRLMFGGDSEPSAPTMALSEPTLAAADGVTSAVAGEASGGPSAPLDEIVDEPEPVAIAADPDVVAAAVRAHQVRALDALLVDEPRSKLGSFEAAVEYCEAREVAGIRGWRVPTLGELRTLGGAKMFKPGTYWSDTLADAVGDERFVWVASRRKPVPHTTRWRKGRVVCVRLR